VQKLLEFADKTSGYVDKVVGDRLWKVSSEKSGLYKNETRKPLPELQLLVFIVSPLEER
jgi:hypothetical protein